MKDNSVTERQQCHVVVNAILIENHSRLACPSLLQLIHGKPVAGVSSRYFWIIDWLYILLLVGDVALNPGLSQYPYTACVRPVGSNQHALCCDMCQRWTHATCGGVSTKQYSDMASQEEFPWCCPSCLLSELLLYNEDGNDTSVDIIIEDHSDDLPITSDVLCIPCFGLRFVHHNVQGLWSKWDDLSRWMAASVDSVGVFCFSEIWMKPEMMLHMLGL